MAEPIVNSEKALKTAMESTSVNHIKLGNVVIDRLYIDRDVVISGFGKGLSTLECRRIDIAGAKVIFENVTVKCRRICAKNADLTFRNSDVGVDYGIVCNGKRFTAVNTDFGSTGEVRLALVDFSGGELFIDGCSFKNGGDGVIVGKSRAVVKNSLFEGCHTALSLHSGSEGTVENCNFVSGARGVEISGGSRCTIFGCSFSEHELSEVVISESPGCRILMSDFTEKKQVVNSLADMISLSKYAVSSDSDVVIEGCRFAGYFDCFNISLEKGTYLIKDSVFVDVCSVFEYTEIVSIVKSISPEMAEDFDVRINIEGCRFENVKTVVFSDGSRVTVTDSVFYGGEENIDIFAVGYALITIRNSRFKKLFPKTEEREPEIFFKGEDNVIIIESPVPESLTGD